MELDRRRLLLYGCSCLVLLSIAALTAILLPAQVVPEDGLTANQRLQRESELRGSLLQAVAGLVVAIGAMFAAWNVVLNREATRLTDRGQVTDRFTTAIEHMADDRVEVRLGGIYALRRLSADSTDDAETVTEVLSGFIRTHGASRAGPSSPSPLRDDLLVALSVLVENRAHTKKRPNLRGVDFSGADLSNLYLSRFDLHEADLRGCTLIGAKLMNIDLMDADLRGAKLFAADLSGANLVRADLSEATLVQAFLFNANMTGTKTQGTVLVRTDLSGVIATEADFRGSRHDSSTTWPSDFSSRFEPLA